MSDQRGYERDDDSPKPNLIIGAGSEGMPVATACKMARRSAHAVCGWDLA